MMRLNDMELLVAVDVVSSKLAMTNECHKVVKSALVILPVPPKNRSARRDDLSGRSGKTNGIVKQAKIRAGRKRNYYRSEVRRARN